MQDRFNKISSDYGELFAEVFEVQGLNYEKLQKSVYNEVIKFLGKDQKIRVLDIGIGDGETIKSFINNNFSNLVGIDLNHEMISTCKKKFGDKIKLFQMDATNLSRFRKNEFDAIITGMCIHNIPVKERKKFWEHIRRIQPKIFVAAEKIADENLEIHIKKYNSEIKAIKEVYEKRHQLKTVANAWIEHYKYDEKEKLTLEEIKRELSDNYNLKIPLEMGMTKTIVATIK